MTNWSKFCFFLTSKFVKILFLSDQNTKLVKIYQQNIKLVTNWSKFCFFQIKFSYNYQKNQIWQKIIYKKIKIIKDWSKFGF